MIYSNLLFPIFSCEISALNNNTELQNCQECDQLEPGQTEITPESEIIETEITTSSNQNKTTENVNIDTNKFVENTTVSAVVTEISNYTEDKTEEITTHLSTISEFVDNVTQIVLIDVDNNVENNTEKIKRITKINKTENLNKEVEEISTHTTKIIIPYELDNYFENINVTTFSEIKNYDESPKIYDTDKLDALSFISTTVGIAILIITIAVISILITRYRNKNKFVNKMKFDSSNNDKRNMYRSTFHAPLPGNIINLFIK